jgi:hypothetical protein
MNIRAMVGSHEVQNVLKRGLSSMEDDLAVVNDPNARKRDKKESLKRMSQCVDTLNIALAKQDSNFTRIKGADSASYVAKRLATADKRKLRDEANGLELGAFEEVQAWRARSIEDDQGEMVTPHRTQYHKRAKGDSDINQQPVVESHEDAMQVDMDSFINLAPGPELSPENLVRIMCKIPKGKRLIVAEKWKQNNVIPVAARNMMRRVELYHAGQEEKAFKAWGHGGGSDAVISIDEFKTWVFSHRPGHTLGTAEVRAYLRGIRGQNVSESTARNYKAIAIALSNSVTQNANHKQEARDTAERSLRRVQAFATLITAVSVRPGSSTHRPRAYTDVEHTDVETQRDRPTHLQEDTHTV